MQLRFCSQHAATGPQFRQGNGGLRLEGRVEFTKIRTFIVPCCPNSGRLSQALAEQFCVKLQQDGLTVSIVLISDTTWLLSKKSARVFVVVEFAQAPDSKFEGNKGGQ